MRSLSTPWPPAAARRRARWTAAFWARHGLDRCQVLGPAPAPADAPVLDGKPMATIIVPARPEQRR